MQTRAIRSGLPFFALAAMACQQPAVTAVHDAGHREPPPMTDDAGMPIDPGLHPFPDAAVSESGGNPFTDTPKCAEDVQMAQHLPLDLVLLVDRSSSMAGPKWDMTTKALTTFLADPRSTGLGVGLQFFPVSETEKACKGDSDCGGAGAQTCLDTRVCLGPNIDVNKPQYCGAAGDPACPAGAMCVPLGECSQSSSFCTAIGKACPGGGGDVCNVIGKTCRRADFSESCNIGDYAQLNVRIGPLPAAQAALVRVINATTPDGATPLVLALQGTLPIMRAYQAANPSHRVVLIIATDGVPACGVPNIPKDVANIVGQLSAARMTPPSISTYVIGTFAADEGTDGPMAVNQFATAGGTAPAFVLAPTSDLTQQLLDTLDKIRGAALPCAFAIPPPKTGVIDFEKVNVHFKGASGESDVPYVGSMDKCDPVRGGWYYDVDPTTSQPKQVIVCSKTCDAFKAESSGQVEIGFGCKTRVIQ